MLIGKELPPLSKAISFGKKMSLKSTLFYLI